MISEGRRQCYALGCKSRVAKRYLMCRNHWWMVPLGIQDAVLISHHRREGGGPSRPYLIAIARAKLAVAVAEHCTMGTVDALEAQIVKLEA